MKKPLKVIGAVVAVFVGGVGLLSGLGAFWYATAKDVPVTTDDRALVVRAADLTPFFEDYAPSEQYESFEKLRFVDTSSELNYEYDSPVEDDPYISVSITYEPSRNDADSSYAMAWSAAQLGMNLADDNIDVDEDNSIGYSAGDRSRLGVITYQGQPVGHLFVAQQGNTVFAFTMTGLLLEDPAVWQELLSVRVSSLSQFR